MTSSSSNEGPYLFAKDKENPLFIKKFLKYKIFI